MSYQILFITENNNMFAGSYRIWVNDLNQYVNKLNTENVQSQIYNKGVDLEKFDCFICGKNEIDLAKKIKNMFPKKKVGIINLSSDKKGLPIDFVIVGSVEEKISLSHYSNVFIFPLIENMFQNCEMKNHTQKDKIRIGFHGSHTHLSKFEPHLKNALEAIDKKRDIELFLITSNKNFNWKVGRPNIKNITTKQWNMETIKEDILSCDIGIVPNVTNVELDMSRNHIDQGLYNTDFSFRMKNKSNAGRAFVFHQLGVPVVADLTPSNLHILGNPECGYVANTKESWEKSILELFDHETRNFVSMNAKKEFDILYNPQRWATSLIRQIRRI